MANRLDFYTPVVGRFVSGDLLNKRTKDSDNREIDADKQRIEFGVAFEKAAIWPMLAEQWFPYLASELSRDQNALTRAQNWFSTFSGFSMKVSDGDAPRKNGSVNEHTKGCFVIYFTSLDVPQTVGPDPTFAAVPADTIKRGFYVQVAGNIVPNGQQSDRAGIYVNASAVRLIAEGDIIVGGADAETLFGGAAAPAALPPGARPLGSSSPVAGSFPTSAPAQPQTAPAAQDRSLPGFAAPQMTASPTEPHTAILAGPPRMPS